MQKLVVVFRLCIGSREFHTHIILRESMHGASATGLFEQHFCLLTDVLVVERTCFLIGEFQQTLTTQLFVFLTDYIGYLQR